VKLQRKQFYIPNRSHLSPVSTPDKVIAFSTSMGGTLTGCGGDVLIIDDPLKVR
jgi:hypothetical protein